MEKTAPGLVVPTLHYSNTPAWTHTMAGNLFDLPDRLPETEIFTPLFPDHGVLIERIVSSGHETAEGEWYDQDRDEWVVLLRGGARVCFEDSAEMVTLAPGDTLSIAAHRRHRVEWTDVDQPTVWLAVHYAP